VGGLFDSGVCSLDHAAHGTLGTIHIVNYLARMQSLAALEEASA